VLVCLITVPLLHQVGPLLRQPYWLDEAWVAVSTKAGFADVPWTTASSPIGLTALVSLLPAYGQIARLIPLAFLAGSVIGGYAFGRVLGWPTRARSIIAGAAGAAAALLLPAQFARHDLKQYTADAAVALALLTYTAWAESKWSRRRLAGVCAAIVVGMLFSHPAALVGAAVLVGLTVTTAVTTAVTTGATTPDTSAARRWVRLRDTVVAASVTAAAMAGIYLVVDRTGRTSGLSEYWTPYFPSLTGLPGYLTTRLDQLRPALGMPWPLLLTLAAVGVVTVARLRRPATATALLALPVITVSAGVTRRYPLLDQRTSHFLLVTIAVLAAIGVVGLATAATAGVAALRRGARIRTTPARTRVEGGLVALAVLLAVAGFATANRDWLLHPRSPAPTNENVEAQVAYIDAHRGPADSILINLSGQYGFAYYWSADQPRAYRGGPQATGWNLDYPAADRIVIAADRDWTSIARAVAAADRATGPGGHIWLVRTHVNADEELAWREVLAGRPIQLIPVGVEPLAELSPE
jgi:hypothetical protein